jgi:hypothetical protein
MRAARSAEQALRLAATTHSQQYICHACRLQAARQFSTTSPRAADLPLWKRLQQSVFGSKESDKAAKSREEKHQRRVEELAQKPAGEVERKTDAQGREYEVAALVDPSVNKDYVPASSWDGLERIGSVEWVKQRADQGEKYVGFAPAKRLELSNAQWEMLLKHVAVEALVLHRAGREIEEICRSRIPDARSWLYTRGATLEISPDGTVGVTFPQAEAEEEILRAVPGEENVQDDEAVSREVEAAIAESAEGEGDAATTNSPPAWMSISLHDPVLKLAVRPLPAPLASIFLHLY